MQKMMQDSDFMCRCTLFAIHFFIMIQNDVIVALNKGRVPTIAINYFLNALRTTLTWIFDFPSFLVCIYYVILIA